MLIIVYLGTKNFILLKVPPPPPHTHTYMCGLKIGGDLLAQSLEMLWRGRDLPNPSTKLGTAAGLCPFPLVGGWVRLMKHFFFSFYFLLNFNFIFFSYILFRFLYFRFVCFSFFFFLSKGVALQPQCNYHLFFVVFLGRKYSPPFPFAPLKHSHTITLSGGSGGVTSRCFWR